MEKNKVKKQIPLRVIVSAALLIALEIILNRFLSINNSGWKIGFSFVPVVVAALLYGPWIAGTVGGMGDLIGSILFPIGPYFPGFTLCAFFMGFVYGIFLYKKKGKLFPHVIPPVLINYIVFGQLINTFWVSILSGKKTYWGWFVYRIPEYALLIPVSIIMIPILIKLCDKIRNTLEKG